MSIRLIEAIQLNKQHVPVDGATLTLTPDVEADLVAQNKAVWVSKPGLALDQGVELRGKVDPVTGGVKKIEVSGQQVSSGPVTRVAGTRILKASADKLLCDGVEVREIGVCAYNQLTNHVLGTSQSYLDEFPLIARSGFRFVRLMGGPLWPSEWTASYGANKPLYFKRIKQVLDCAAEHGLGVVLSVFWRHATQADLASERVNAGLGTAGSATRARCATIIQEYAAAFKDHPAFAAWEIGNEYSLFAANASLPTANAGNGTPASYSAPDDTLTLASMRSFYEFFASTVRAYDTTGRIILTGNGGPGGVLEKSMENYLTIVPLDNPGQINTISIHKYSRNEFGNRAYADLTDTLISMRKLAKTAGKPFILGEFGMERNETYGGYGGDSVFEAGCQAVYRSGVSLSFCWNWQQDTGTGANNFNFHPLNTANGTNTKFEILRRFNNLMRLDGPVIVDDVSETKPVVRGGQVVEVPGAGNACLLTVADNAALKPAGGFAVSFWAKLTKDGLTNRRIARKYGGNAGWYVGLDGNSPASVTCQVQYTDGTTQNLGGQAYRQTVEDDEHHYIFQFNPTAGQATTGLTVFEDGRWVKTLAPTPGKTWVPSSDPLLFFGDAGPTSVSYVGLKDFRLHAPLNDVQARNLYLYDVLPAGSLAGEWSFDGNYNDTSGNGNHATVTSGTPAFVDFPK